MLSVATWRNSTFVYRLKYSSPQSFPATFVAKMTGFSEKAILIDGRGHLLGRLAAIVAKTILQGDKVIVVRTEQINISGNFFSQESTMLFVNFTNSKNMHLTHCGSYCFGERARINLRNGAPHCIARYCILENSAVKVFVQMEHGPAGVSVIKVLGWQGCLNHSLNKAARAKRSQHPGHCLLTSEDDRPIYQTLIELFGGKLKSRPLLRPELVTVRPGRCVTSPARQ
ncbi:60S ribosomal protein L13A [Homalodisca vitripennis]|nr:60S ribosomal protein L13A [Homalodisca vitripennis]